MFRSACWILRSSRICGKRVSRRGPVDVDVDVDVVCPLAPVGVSSGTSRCVPGDLRTVASQGRRPPLSTVADRRVDRERLLGRTTDPIMWPPGGGRMLIIQSGADCRHRGPGGPRDCHHPLHSCGPGGRNSGGAVWRVDGNSCHRGATDPSHYVGGAAS